MKVKELIESLSKCDQDMDVVLDPNFIGYYNKEVGIVCSKEERFCFAEKIDSPRFSKKIIVLSPVF